MRQFAIVPNEDLILKQNIQKNNLGVIVLYIPLYIFAIYMVEDLLMHCLFFYRTETHIDRAGGYSSNLPCIRALQEAFSGLYHGFT